MQWDLGIAGVGLLVAMSLVFGAAVHLVWRGAVRRLWLWAAAAGVAAGVLISEVWFGWATQTELQPNVDGLSFDEVLLGLVCAVAITALGRLVYRRRARARRDGVRT
jgi:Na+/proline symporter